MVARLFRRTLLVACALAAACSGDQTPHSSPPPSAEFLLGAADSTWWVATHAGEIHVRGAPLVLTKYDGRLYEIYAHHDDRSYPDAVLLGDRLYRRDLITGDSLLVFADSAVPRFARDYARAHPDDRPLRHDEEGDANPSTSVTAEIDILDVFGPYLSYEYHLDVELAGKTPWHTTRQGVVDLRTGKAADVADLVGRETGARLVNDARRSFTAIRDSIVRERPSLEGDERRAAAALERTHFDERSFTLSSVDGNLAVRFGIPGQGEGPAGGIVQLEPLSVDSVAWWNAIVPTIPTRDEKGNDRWRGRGYRILARYDTSGDVATIALADEAKHEWSVASTRSPLFQALWLDDPPMGEDVRQALTRAFNHAASYDEGARVAERNVAPGLLVASNNASNQNRPRKPARDIRTHDARACEQHGPCVRRGHLVDDGQSRRDRRVSTQSLQRRDRLD